MIDIVEVTTDKIEPRYKQTAIDAAKCAPKHSTLKEVSGYIFDEMKRHHPKVAWCVEVFRCSEAGDVTETTYLWRSSKALQFLTFRLGKELFFRVFVVKSLAEVKEIENSQKALEKTKALLQ